MLLNRPDIQANKINNQRIIDQHKFKVKQEYHIPQISISETIKIIIQIMKQNIKGFDQQDIGLFTFYRQQAEYEERKQEERKHRIMLRKQERDEEERRKKQKYEQYKEKKQIILKSISSSPSVPVSKQDYTEKAKKYIKQLQSYGHNKLLHELRRKQRKRYNDNDNENDNNNKSKDQLDTSGKFQRYQHVSSQKAIDKVANPAQTKSSQIFANKKDIAKLCYYQLMNKEAVTPKQFNSIQIFEINNPPQILRLQQIQQILRKKASASELKQQKGMALNLKRSQKLPKISPESYNSARKSVQLPMPKSKIKKKIPNYYNPIDIILNNQKYHINQLQKSNRIHGKQQEHSIKMDMVSKQNSILNMINRFKVIK